MMSDKDRKEKQKQEIMMEMKKEEEAKQKMKEDVKAEIKAEMKAKKKAKSKRKRVSSSDTSSESSESGTSSGDSSSDNATKKKKKKKKKSKKKKKKPTPKDKGEVEAYKMWAQSVNQQQTDARNHEQSQARFKQRAKLATKLQEGGLEYNNNMARALLGVEAFDTVLEVPSRMIGMDEEDDADAEEA
jgi:hypothetical protein